MSVVGGYGRSLLQGRIRSSDRCNGSYPFRPLDFGGFEITDKSQTRCLSIDSICANESFTFYHSCHPSSTL